MPRRPARVRPDVPLFLIPPVIKKEIGRAGEELVRIVVRKTSLHYYNVSIHTRSVNRELQAELARAGKPGRSGGSP